MNPLFALPLYNWPGRLGTFFRYLSPSHAGHYDKGERAGYSRYSEKTFPLIIIAGLLVALSSLTLFLEPYNYSTTVRRQRLHCSSVYPIDGGA